MKIKVFVSVMFLLGVVAPASAQVQIDPLEYMRASSVCMRNYKKLLKTLGQPEDIRGDHNYEETPEYREILGLYSRILQPCAETDWLTKQNLKRLQDHLGRIDLACKEYDHRKRVPIWGGAAVWPSEYEVNCTSVYADKYPDVLKYLAQLRAEVPKALSDPDYSADLGPISGGAAAGASRATSAPAPDCADGNISAANEEMKAIDDALASYNQQVPGNNTAMTPALQAVMWGASKQAEVIKKYCPKSASFQDRLASLHASYEAALRACRQVASSPDTACIPALSDSAASESQLPQIPVPKVSSTSGNASATGTTAAGAETGSNAGTVPRAATKGAATAQNSASSPQTVAAKESKQHGPIDASSCIVQKNSRLVNTCDFEVEVGFCVENPKQTKNFFDNSDAFKCPNGGMSTVGAGKTEPNILHGDVWWFACSEVDIATMQTHFHTGTGYQGSCY